MCYSQWAISTNVRIVNLDFFQVLYKWDMCSSQQTHRRDRTVLGDWLMSSDMNFSQISFVLCVMFVCIINIMYAECEPPESHHEM